MKNLIKRILFHILNPIFLILYRKYLPNFKQDFNCAPVFMIRELPGGEKEWQGKKHRKAYLGNTHPWNRYFNKPLSTRPENLKDIESFLRKCKYVSDRETRSQKDFWEPPDIFEKRRKGDCEDHSIWAWRQLDDMDFKARLVIGTSESCGHAWVHIFVNGRCYLLEATHKHGWLWSSPDFMDTISR